MNRETLKATQLSYLKKLVRREQVKAAGEYAKKEETGGNVEELEAARQKLLWIRELHMAIMTEYEKEVLMCGENDGDQIGFEYIARIDNDADEQSAG